MNKTTLRGIGLFAALAAVFLVFTSAFVVRQIDYALVLRLGKVRAVIAEPGLHFKVPFIEAVTYFDRRVLSLDLPLQSILATDQQNLEVDAFLRFRIEDPLQFLTGATNMSIANQRLTNFANSAMRNVLASSSSDAIIRTNRANLMKRVQQQLQEETKTLGISVIDMRLTRVDLPAGISQKVYDRMNADRIREATEIRAQGDQQASIIRAKAQRDATVIVAEANQKAQELRGQGDAEKNRILAEAFGSDPEFFAFLRSMQAYQAGLTDKNTKLVLNPDSEFFKYFRNPLGGDKQGQSSAPTRTLAPAQAQ